MHRKNETNFLALEIFFPLESIKAKRLMGKAMKHLSNAQ